MSDSSTHKAGFVSIVGKPNVGKSTLMNTMLGEKLSITTSKAQTTRHRIMGIMNDDNYQIVFSDTPGIIESKYELHKSMMNFVDSSLSDADVILFITDIYEKYDEDPVVEKLKKLELPIILLINKVDQVKDQQEVIDKVAYWQEKLTPTEILPISALHQFNTAEVLKLILSFVPEHPAYYDKDQLSDRPLRFFASEMIREKIFEIYKKEVPYSCEVQITEYKHEPDIDMIYAEILVERDSQKGILIGKGGEKLKKVGIQARKDLETFLDKKVYLDLHVKVEPDWRKKVEKLKKLGYNN